MTYPSQPNPQEPLYPQPQPSSPYYQPPGPTGSGYGSPPPHYPQQGYPPPQQPYPGYGQPAAPQYPPAQQPYQGMPPPQGYYAPPLPYIPPPPTAKRSNSGLIITLAVVVVLVLGGVLHYGVFGPASVVKSYLQAVVRSDGTAAYRLVCSAQHNSDLTALYSQLSQTSGNSIVKFDTNSAQYTTSDWGLTTATVHLGGSLSGTSNGLTASIFLNEDFPMAAAGLGWCIDTANLGTLELQHSH